MSSQLNLLPYYGGKSKWLAEILPYFRTEHSSFASGFCGMCSIELNKAPCFVETLNDKDDLIVNLLEVIRTQPEKLYEALRLTPWARAEYEKARRSLDGLDSFEKARLFYVRLRQGFNSIPREKSSGFKYCVKGEARGASTTRSWRNGINQIFEISERLLMYQIENLDILKFIPTYDDSGALFYLDPPYVKSTRNRNTDQYNHEMTDEEHEEMLRLCSQSNGKFLISGYASELYDQCKFISDWNRIELKSKRITSSRQQNERREVLWFNYDLDKEPSLFDLLEIS